MDTKKLEALAAAVEYGSFTRAAENLGYTQSGLTHMMNSLEKDIGFPVLLRGRQGVRLTLDADLQRACEGLATLYLPRGCIVVMDTATGEVLASMRGEIVQALVEGVSRRRENQLTGKTGRNINVNFNGAPDDIGKMVRVRITGAGSNTLRGEKVEE